MSYQLNGFGFSADASVKIPYFPINISLQSICTFILQRAQIADRCDCATLMAATRDQRARVTNAVQQYLQDVVVPEIISAGIPQCGDNISGWQDVAIAASGSIRLDSSGFSIDTNALLETGAQIAFCELMDEILNLTGITGRINQFADGLLRALQQGCSALGLQEQQPPPLPDPGNFSPPLPPPSPPNPGASPPPYTPPPPPQQSRTTIVAPPPIVVSSKKTAPIVQWTVAGGAVVVASFLVFRAIR